MRQSLKKVISVICMVSMLIGLVPASFAANGGRDAAAAARTEVLINDGWTFTHGADESQNGQVDLPHTWNVEDTGKGYGMYDGTYFRGLGIYEKTLDVSAYQQGRVFLHFGAANKLADVYIDDQFVGRHIGGYTAFAFDITEFVQEKDSVKVKVEVNNALSFVLEDGTNLNTYPPASTTTTAPDYNIWGGIHRDVHIINTNDAHFALESEDVYASNGVYLNQSVRNISNDLTTGKKGDAALDITAKVVLAAEGDVVLTAKVFDRDGKQVAASAMQVSGEAGCNEFTMKTMEIKDAKLWNGRADGESRAYLYRVLVRMSDLEGNVLDEVMDRVGFRTFEYQSIGKAVASKEKGGKGSSFLLNGEEYLLYGAAMHGDFQDYGNALSKEQWDTSFALMNEIGLNTIRAAHYPYPPYFYSTADEFGYVVWAENAATNSMSPFEAYVDENNWKHSKGQLNTFDQLRELVYQNYNHPSIYTWCLSNEVASNGDTTGGFGQGGWGAEGDRSVTKEMVFLRQMQEVVKEIDRQDDRLVSLTDNFCFSGIDQKMFISEGSTGTDTDSGIVDLIGAHYYFGTYTAGAAGIGSDIYPLAGTKPPKEGPVGLAAIQRLYPNALVNLSEYGVGGDPNVFMKDATGEELDESQMAATYAQLMSFGSKKLYNPDGSPYVDNAQQQLSATNHPIEYMSRWHEMTYDVLADFPWVMGTYIWNMFDFGINHRKEGGTLEMVGQNDKGLVTYDRETKKDPFFYYKANWNQVEDFVHINTGERWEHLDTRMGTWNKEVQNDRYWELEGDYVEQTYDIRVYSNIDYEDSETEGQKPLALGALRLFVNGEQVGGAAESGLIVPKRVQEHVYVFENVPITSRVVDGVIDNEIKVEIYDYTPITNTVGSLLVSTTAGKDEGESLEATLARYSDSGYTERPIQESDDEVDVEKGTYVLTNSAVTHTGLGRSTSISIARQGTPGVLADARLLVIATMSGGSTACWTVPADITGAKATDLSFGAGIASAKVYLINGPMDLGDENFGGVKSNILTITL